MVGGWELIFKITIDQIQYENFSYESIIGI